MSCKYSIRTQRGIFHTVRFTRFLLKEKIYELSVIYVCPYQVGVRRVGFHCTCSINGCRIC